MSLVLTVDGEAWRDRVETVAAQYDPLVPVVKGNGYGFGRTALAGIAARLIAEAGRTEFEATIAVGTVHELAGLPDSLRALVLVPVGAADADVLAAESTLRRPPPIATVASLGDLEALGTWRGPVVVKLESSMRRFGAAADRVGPLSAACADRGFEVVGYALHLPLAGTDIDRRAEVEGWLARLEPPDHAERALWLSHLGADAHRVLRAAHPEWRFPMRAGTALWLGDKTGLHLGADTLEVRRTDAGQPAGYRATPAPAAGSLVVVGAGTAHGVAPLDDGRSPFHFRRRRVDLLERPHMHTSTLFVPDADPVPQVGELLDVQRPFTLVTVDKVVWR